jgi:hypothetical protein
MVSGFRRSAAGPNRLEGGWRALLRNWKRALALVFGVSPGVYNEGMAETQRTGQQNDSEGPVKKRPRGRPFTKNDSRLRQNLEAARRTGSTMSTGMIMGIVEEEAAQGAVPAGDGVPQQLADMRHVYERPAREDRTPGQKTCRKWLKDDLPGFMARKTGLEAKLLASGGRPSPPALGVGADLLAALGKDVVVLAVEQEDGCCNLLLHLDERKWGPASGGVWVSALYWGIEGRAQCVEGALDIPAEDVVYLQEDGRPCGFDHLARWLRRALDELRARSAGRPPA